MLNVIEDDFIFFYEINKETLIPTVKNVMKNFMQCGMIRFGEKNIYCVTYKLNQPNFNKYKRKMDHDFRVCVNTEDYEHALGFNLANNCYFLVIKQNG